MSNPPASPLQPPPDRAVRRVVDAVAANPRDVGVGIVDMSTGQIYVSPASVTPDHPSLAEDALGISNIGDAEDLRGFIFGSEKGKWVFANNSSLNGRGNKMDTELFENVEAILGPKLGPCP